ncbi:colicin import membrane protein [Luteimonas cucumeris]|uniref:Colicin import membrane protein n=1 Tax=Luteimonas cucumeris TaxID=985012 RepID=A0A562L522_9GAMM|nr:cell envelope integrity protein TolA [Luteimonas cucumeris]TWI02762.1 colicin import membrane protein [Luteimonas cucumeris]
MRETRADTTRAFLYAIALHVLLFLLAFMGLWWTRSTAPVSAAGPVVEAELIDPNALSVQMKRVLRQRPEPVPPVPEPEPPPQAAEEETAPPPQPEPEPRPEDSPVPPQIVPQEQVPEPDARDQERVDREALAAEQREKEQEEKRRQEQIDLTEERERQEEAEKKQRLAQQQREEELKKIRAEIAKAKREEDLAEQKLRQLANRRAQPAPAEAASSSASPPPGNEGVDSNLKAQYAAAIQEAILRNWTRPETVPLGQRCRLNIRQLPGGDVISVDVSPSCPYDELGRRSVEAAVRKAAPLPYAGFESVFQRDLILNFEAQDR